MEGVEEVPLPAKPSKLGAAKVTGCTLRSVRSSRCSRHKGGRRRTGLVLRASRLNQRLRNIATLHSKRNGKPASRGATARTGHGDTRQARARAKNTEINE